MCSCPWGSILCSSLWSEARQSGIESSPSIHGLKSEKHSPCPQRAHSFGEKRQGANDTAKSDETHETMLWEPRGGGFPVQPEGGLREGFLEEVIPEKETARSDA
jgi:hypothetical protein